jgi:hypothetical protein
LLDRTAETGALEGVQAAVRDGLSGVLVLRGEAGVGKTALLDWAAEQAGDMQVARVAGAEAEMDMGFAGLHQLLVPFMAGLEGLPAPQQQALKSAFGLVAGPPPDRFLVGLAALTVLTDAAAARPVLCLIDDVQWLDRVSIEVLGFVARRLYADRVGMVFAARQGEEQALILAGLPELTVGGLAEEAARELLARSAGTEVDRQVGWRIVADTAGNPLALVELAAELTAAELSGTEPLDWPLRFRGRLEELYRSRMRALPGGTQTLMLLAAADPTGEPALIWNAARNLGVDPGAAEAAGAERLVSWEPRVRFRHPLIRSAAYYAFPAAERRGAHQALAMVTDPEADPDRRAWHLAEAADGPDEQVAAELERSADRARGRGGWGSGAAFLERAAALTPDEEHRARRMLAAAENRLAAGEAPAGTAGPGGPAPGRCTGPGKGQAAGGPEPVRGRADARGYVGAARRGPDGAAVRDPPGPRHPARRVGSGPVLRPARGRDGRVPAGGPLGAGDGGLRGDRGRPAARRLRGRGRAPLRGRRRAAPPGHQAAVRRPVDGRRCPAAPHGHGHGRRHAVRRLGPVPDGKAMGGGVA